MGHQVYTKLVGFDPAILGQMHGRSNNQTNPVMPLGPGWSDLTGRARSDFSTIVLGQMMEVDLFFW